MEDVKNLEVNFNDSQEALYEIQLELDELMMALVSLQMIMILLLS